MTSRHLLRGLACSLLLACAPLASAVDFTVTSVDAVAKTLAPASGGSETGTVTATGDLNVAGGAVAVTITGGSGTRTAVVNNSGRIRQLTAAGGRAIRNSSGAATISLNNAPGALIQAADADAIQISVAGSSVSLDNAGSIVVAPNPSAGGNQAIDWNGITTGSNVLVNRQSGVLRATAADAARPGVNGAITNDGIIQAIPAAEAAAGVTQASSSDGVDAQTNSGISVTNSGSISGRHGITGGATTAANFTISVSNLTGGLINGVNGSGINIDSNGTRLGNAVVVNSGSIIGNFDSANYTVGDGDGVDVDGLCTLTNNGIIRGLGAGGLGSDGGANNPEGVSIGGGTVINNAGAEITGQETTGSGRKGHGLLVDDSSGGNAPGATTITNAGLIRGYDSYAIRLVSTFANTIGNETTGTIRGGGNLVEGAAIQASAGIDTLTNRGAIVGDNGLAVDLGAGNDVMHIVGDSASITGDISGGAGANTLDIDPALDTASGSSQAFSYSGVLSNFASVMIRSGTVTFSGASTYAGDTTVSGGSLIVTNSSGSATGTGAVIVQAGAQLSGTGSVASVDLRSGGRLATVPFGQPLNISGDLAFTGGSQFDFEPGFQGPVSIGGVLSLAGAGAAVVNLNILGIVPGNDYTLIRFASTNATTASFSLGAGLEGLGATLELTSNALVLHTPSARISLATLDFGTQPTNTVSEEQAITISSTGTAPLVVGAPAIVEDAAGAFRIVNNTCTSAIEPGSVCVIGVRFAPRIAGSNQTAILSIPTNVGNVASVVGLTGTAVDALYRLEASPGSVAFDNQPVGTSSAPNFVQLRNTGNSPIAVISFNASGTQATDFSYVGGDCAGRNLAPGDSCSVAFTFNPSAPGVRSASEQVVAFPAETGAATNISLSGVGIQAGASLSPANLVFGNQPLNIRSLSRPVNLINTGNSTLTITSISASSGFVQENGCPTVLAVGASCTIDVSFTPTSAGAVTGELLVSSNATNSPTRVALSGTGVAPTPGTLGLVTANVSVLEGSGNLVFDVARTGGSDGAVSVAYATSDGTAQAGRDYTARTGTLTWAEGDTSPRQIIVPILDNRRGDGSRSFSLTLTAPTGNAGLGTATGTGTITDNDRTGFIRFDAPFAQVSDRAGSVALIVHRGPGAGRAVSVRYTTRNLTALAGAHYTAASGELSWAAGDVSDRIINVPITAGALARGQRSFSVQLSVPTGGALPGLPLNEVVTIQYGG